MNLFILRHGLAAELGEHGITRDSDRPLTAEGKAKLSKIAAAMQALELSFDLILSSPYVRARETADIVADILHCRKKLEFTDALVPPGNARKLVDLIDHSDKSCKNVLLVGHEPFLSELISLLVSGGPGVSIQMKKGGLAKVSTDSLHPGHCATLEWLLTPRQMQLMA